jgi:aminomethyltransferase
MASAYDPHPDREYAAIRNAAALIDVSPLYKYRITGRDAARLLDRVITRDMTKLKPGQVYYTPWCDAAGKVIDSHPPPRRREPLHPPSPTRWLTLAPPGSPSISRGVRRRGGAACRD